MAHPLPLFRMKKFVSFLLAGSLGVATALPAFAQSSSSSASSATSSSAASSVESSSESSASSSVFSVPEEGCNSLTTQEEKAECKKAAMAKCKQEHPTMGVTFGQCVAKSSGGNGKNIMRRGPTMAKKAVVKHMVKKQIKQETKKQSGRLLKQAVKEQAVQRVIKREKTNKKGR